MNRLIIVVLFLFFVGQTYAQEPSVILSLDSCRALAINNNKELRMTNNIRKEAYYERKAAFTKYMPRINATGAYIYTSKEISILNNEQKETLNNLGTNIGTLSPSLQSMSDMFNDVGSSIVDAFDTDTHNMGTAGVILTQPIYMGGKIAAYNSITRYAEQVAMQQHNLALQNVILKVDETYWQIVSLQNKKKLAESYLKLVLKLNDDVQQMIDKGFATKADGLSVKVKINEAQVALLQVNNGLSLSRMLLCQLCGLYMKSSVILSDDELPDSIPVMADVQSALSKRPELNILSLSANIYKDKIRLARSEFLPNVALTGSYMATNPSLFNSFERRMKGMWSVGVMVNIPLVTFGERIYKEKAARLNAANAVYRLEETREKVELQVNQNQQKVQEAIERLQTSNHSCDEADENLRFATLGLKEGVIPVSNVLEAQTAWLKSYSERVSSQIDLRLANLYLLKSAGILNINN